MHKKTLAKYALTLAVFTLSQPLWSQDKGSKLTGTPIGSPSVDYNTGQQSSTVNTPACAFDGDLQIIKLTATTLELQSDDETMKFTRVK